MKKLFVVLLSVLCVLSLAACGGKKDEKTISVACSPTPHAEILEKAKEILAKDGWTLDIREFEDYVQPIKVVESGEIDANYFAHTPYLNDYNNENGTSQVVVGKVHYEPFGIYAGKKTSLADLEDGDEILVPSDSTNETRALLLLQDNGIIELPEGTGADTIVSKNDIVKYNVQVDITELEAAQIGRSRADAAVVILNGNYALAEGLNVLKDSIAFEKSDSSAAKTYANVLAVKKGNENNEGIKALVEVLESQEIKDFITKTYEGSVVAYTE